ncbi:hypothetical protein [Streptacidiphilus sp. EB129]|jgi:hypothetical protein|uniref:hypothetical protein n=1 Tax=Streptacidiphilus sp. EB129 TaxID=3156262 RepID=UPI003512DADB
MYEIRLELKPGAPPVQLWHICETATTTTLCARVLSPASKTLPFAEWAAQRHSCPTCDLEYTARTPPPGLA